MIRSDSSSSTSVLESPPSSPKEKKRLKADEVARQKLSSSRTTSSESSSESLIKKSHKHKKREGLIKKAKKTQKIAKEKIPSDVRSKKSKEKKVSGSKSDSEQKKKRRESIGRKSFNAITGQTLLVAFQEQREKMQADEEKASARAAADKKKVAEAEALIDKHQSLKECCTVRVIKLQGHGRRPIFNDVELPTRYFACFHKCGEKKLIKIGTYILFPLVKEEISKKEKKKRNVKHLKKGEEGLKEKNLMIPNSIYSIYYDGKRYDLHISNCSEEHPSNKFLRVKSNKYYDLSGIFLGQHIFTAGDFFPGRIKYSGKSYEEKKKADLNVVF